MKYHEEFISFLNYQEPLLACRYNAEVLAISGADHSMDNVDVVLVNSGDTKKQEARIKLPKLFYEY